MTQQYRINQQIKNPKVRLIDNSGEQIGVIDKAEALDKAQGQGLDLVEVSPKAEPPVCKIMDYGHFLYTQSKLQQKNKSKSRRTEIKGIRITYTMSQHDLEVRVKQAQKFIEQGDKVKAEILMVGRQKAHPDKAKELINEFGNMLDDQVVIEQKPKREGSKFIAIFAPSKK